MKTPINFEEEKISLEVDRQEQVIKIITELCNRRIEETMHLKDEMTRNALIEFGWTPPILQH